MNSGKRTASALRSAGRFLSRVARLVRDLDRENRLQASCYKMWTTFGIEPEVMDDSNMKVVAAGYPLRPEIMESACSMASNARSRRGKSLSIRQKRL